MEQHEYGRTNGRTGLPDTPSETAQNPLGMVELMAAMLKLLKPEDKASLLKLLNGADEPRQP